MKVGDYVRYRDVFNDTIKIRKINEIIPPDMLIKADVYFFNKKECSLKEDITKSSPNIIDLIEVGDYVNGLKVTSVGGTYHGRKDKAIYCDFCENPKTGKWTMIYDDEIKSIVTKEQFESMEYKVGE